MSLTGLPVVGPLFTPRADFSFYSPVAYMSPLHSQELPTFGLPNRIGQIDEIYEKWYLQITPLANLFLPTSFMATVVAQGLHCRSYIVAGRKTPINTISLVARTAFNVSIAYAFPLLNIALSIAFHSKEVFAKLSKKNLENEKRFDYQLKLGTQLLTLVTLLAPLRIKAIAFVAKAILDGYCLKRLYDKHPALSKNYAAIIIASNLYNLNFAWKVLTR
jgi:hypothetical protein